MEKEFNVYGTITIEIDTDIEAESESEAIEKAIENIKNEHHLNVIGYTIKQHDVKYDDFYSNLTDLTKKK